MAIKIYTKEYAGVLENVFGAKQHFLRTFGGQLQVVDGIKNRDEFMTLKVSDTDVVIQDYSTDPDVAFGTGTGTTNRFGERKEIISVDATVEYEKPLAIHEGVDNMTVNDNIDEVIRERTALHAEAWTEALNTFLFNALDEAASKTFTGEVTKVFAEARETMVNNKVSEDLGKTAYVTPKVYTALLRNGLLTSAKGSTVDIDRGEVVMFDGFFVEELAEEYFTGGTNVVFAADNVGVAGVGVEVYRILDSEDFAGVAIQGAGKYGKYIPEKNAKAIFKATAEVNELPKA